MILYNQVFSLWSTRCIGKWNTLQDSRRFTSVQMSVLCMFYIAPRFVVADSGRQWACCQCSQVLLKSTSMVCQRRHQAPSYNHQSSLRARYLTDSQQGRWTGCVHLPTCLRIIVPLIGDQCVVSLPMTQSGHCPLYLTLSSWPSATSSLTSPVSMPRSIEWGKFKY